MWGQLAARPLDVLASVGVHALLVVLLLLSLEWRPALQVPDEVPVIQATAVDETAVLQEMARLKAAEDRKVQAAEDRKRLLEEAARHTEEARKAEQARLDRLKKERAAEEARVAEQKKTQAREQQRLAQIRADQQQAEERRRAEEQRLAQVELKRKQDEERARKAEADRKRREDEARSKAEAEEQLRAQLAAEEARMAEQREREARATVEQFVALIRQKVERNWLRPVGTAAGLRCTVLVQMIPGGGVASVRIATGSGNAAFDRSVEDAVRRAEPLPIPPDPALFDRFREIRFVFEPRS